MHLFFLKFFFFHLESANIYQHVKNPFYTYIFFFFCKNQFIQVRILMRGKSFARDFHLVNAFPCHIYCLKDDYTYIYVWKGPEAEYQTRTNWKEQNCLRAEIIFQYFFKALLMWYKPTMPESKEYSILT